MKSLDLLAPGQRLDRYAVIDVLGQGGMAVVYRVRHLKLGSVHALKVVAVSGRSVAQRLILEGQTQARLRHRHIVAVHDVLDIDGSPGLLMEYVDGPSLDALLGADLSLEQIDRIARGILRGIGAAHAAGLVHRDLKPANVLVALEDDGFVPKVADFGLVKDANADHSHTRSGAYMGTPHYMAPEQITDAKNVDARADLFAAGALLYELVTGEHAFPGSNVLQIFNAVANQPHRDPRTLRPDLPERMAQAIDAALQKDRDARPATADELLAMWCGDVDDAQLPMRLDTVDSEVLAFAREQVRPLPERDPALGHDVPTRSTLAPETFDSDALGGPPVALPPEPPTSGSTARMAGLVLLGSAAASLAVTVAIGAVAWFSLGPPGDRPPQVVEEAPTAEVAVAAAAPPAPPPPPRATLPEPAPIDTPPTRPAPPPTPTPVAPAAAPVAPAPAPAPMPSPEPAPVPQVAEAAPPPVPEPVAASAASPTGHVAVRGDIDVMLVPAGGGSAVSPSAVVPVGRYDVVGDPDGPGGRPPVVLVTIDVAPDRPVSLNCVRALRKCAK